jgi:hypothetical protein
VDAVQREPREPFGRVGVQLVARGRIGSHEESEDHERPDAA